MATECTPEDDCLLLGECSRQIGKQKAVYHVKLSRHQLLLGGRRGAKDWTLNLQDVVGVSSTDNQLIVYWYPRKKPVKDPVKPPARKRTPLTLFFDSREDASENKAEAELWKNTLNSMLKGSAVKRMLVLVNPFSGPGKALSIFQEKVVPIFSEAEIHFNLVVTERAGHATDIVHEMNLDEWYGIIIVSGDGLVFEVVQGLMQRQDAHDAIQTPIGVIPGGSGNALSCALNYYSRESYQEKHIQSAAFLIAKHTVLPLDLVAVDTCGGKRLHSFLSVNWGYMSDVDIESEKMRSLGNARFTVGALLRLVGLRRYRGRVSFRPIKPYQPRVLRPSRFRRTQSELHTMDKDIRTVSMKRATSVITEEAMDSVSWAESVTEEQPLFKPSGDTPELPPLDAPVPDDWVSVEGEFITVAAVFMTHLGPDLIFSTQRRLNEGEIDLVMIHSSISRNKLLKAFLNLAEGKVSPDRDIELVRVTAFRIEPYTDKGYIVVDGEKVDYGPIQGQVSPGIARVMCREPHATS